MGYLLNVTHAVPIQGIETKTFSNIKAQHFVSGGYLLNALITDNIDLAYIGPGPYINSVAKGVPLKLLGLTAIGANSLIISKSFDPEKDFEITRIAVPQLGNTQDLLAKMLMEKLSAHQSLQDHMVPDMKQILEDSHRVNISSELEYIAINPAELETAFFTGDIDAAFVPEPWGTILEEKGMINLSKVLSGGPLSFVDELEAIYDKHVKDDLNRINEFPVTVLVVREDFYNSNQELLQNFLAEQDEILNDIRNKPETTIKAMKSHFKKIAHTKLNDDFVLTCLQKVEFTDELNSEKLEELYEVGFKAKYYKEKDLLKASK